MPFLKVPDFSVPELTRYLADMDERLQRELDTKMSRITANDSLLLQSPAGKVYQVKISDAGALVITLISSTSP